MVRLQMLLHCGYRMEMFVTGRPAGNFSAECSLLFLYPQRSAIASHRKQKLLKAERDLSSSGCLNE